MTQFFVKNTLLSLIKTLDKNRSLLLNLSQMEKKFICFNEEKKKEIHNHTHNVLLEIVAPFKTKKKVTNIK